MFRRRLGTTLLVALFLLGVVLLQGASAVRAADDPKEKQQQIEEAIKRLEEAGRKEQAERLREVRKRLDKQGDVKPLVEEKTKMVRQRLEEAAKRLEDAGLKEAAEQVKQALKTVTDNLPKVDPKAPDKKPPLPGVDKLKDQRQRVEEAIKQLEGTGFKEQAEQLKELLKRLPAPKPPAEKTADLEKKIDELSKQLEDLRRELQKQKRPQ